MDDYDALKYLNHNEAFKDLAFKVKTKFENGIYDFRCELEKMDYSPKEQSEIKILNNVEIYVRYQPGATYNWIAQYRVFDEWQSYPLSPRGKDQIKEHFLDKFMTQGYIHFMTNMIRCFIIASDLDIKDVDSMVNSLKIGSVVDS